MLLKIAYVLTCRMLDLVVLLCRGDQAKAVSGLGMCCFERLPQSSKGPSSLVSAVGVSAPTGLAANLDHDSDLAAAVTSLSRD